MVRVLSVSSVWVLHSQLKASSVNCTITIPQECIAESEFPHAFVLLDAVLKSTLLHVEARPRLLHPALPLPFLPALVLDATVYSAQLERHTRPVICISSSPERTCSGRDVT